MNRLRVLVADHHAAIRQAVVSYLSDLDSVEVVAEASTGHEAVRQAVRLRPDLVLMDLEIPGCGGFKASRIIKSSMPSVVIAILSMQPEEVYRQTALENCADEFIDKGDMKHSLRTLFARSLGDARYGVEEALVS